MRLGMGSRWQPGHAELVLPGTEQQDSVGTARGIGKGHCKARCGILGALGGVTDGTDGVADPACATPHLAEVFCNFGVCFPPSWGTAPLHPAGDVPQAWNIPGAPGREGHQ